jgi:hypothetical protein
MANFATLLCLKSYHLMVKAGFPDSSFADILPIKDLKEARENKKF